MDEIKARTRALQEEGAFAAHSSSLRCGSDCYRIYWTGERKVRDKDRFIQILWKALEVHGIAGPLAPAPGSGTTKLVDGVEEPWRCVCKQARLPRISVQLLSTSVGVQFCDF